MSPKDATAKRNEEVDQFKDNMDRCFRLAAEAFKCTLAARDVDNIWQMERDGGVGVPQGFRAQ